MNSIRNMVEAIRARQEGATAVEYAVMVALIAAVIVIAVIALGRESEQTFQDTADCIEARTTAACSF